jgi:outer membrane protein TolC
VQGFDAGFDWYVGATLSWNLFNGLLTSRQSEEADAAIEVATAQREAVRLTIRAEIEEQLLASEDAKQRQLVAERAVVTARERLEQAEDRYQTGAGEAIDLDDAQVTLANAESQQVQARYDLAIARARLVRALGTER